MRNSGSDQRSTSSAKKGPCRVLEKCAYFKVRAGFRLDP